MRNDLTDITIIVDRSGSMESIKTDAEGGIRTFVADQQKQPGEATLSLIQFDTVYEEVYTAKPINDVPDYTLVPRGGTAYLDALGRAIVMAGERMKAIPEGQRPGLVVMVVVTDGEENSSKEYTHAKIKEMIQHQQDVYKWQFTFLAAGMDAFKEGQALGINAAGVCGFTAENVTRAYASASANIGRMRSSSFKGAEIKNEYTEAEVAAMTGEEK